MAGSISATNTSTCSIASMASSFRTGPAFFGENLSTRFVESMQLITGALPAEYGLRTAGIVDIQTKSGLFAPGGSIGMYGGSYSTLNPSAEYGGSIDGYNYFVSSDYLQSDHGINGVTAKYNQIHDGTEQGHGFAYLEKIIDANNKISAMFGEFNAHFQIPNNPGPADARRHQRDQRDTDFGLQLGATQ